VARVSVLIASYNHGPYIAQAIESVLSQDYQDFEIVVTDDGSADDSVARLRRFTDPRIKLFTFPENRGACTAFRTCLANAGGQYVAVLNSDDVFLPGKLTKQVAYLDLHQDMAAVLGLATIVDAKGKSLAGRTTRAYVTIFEQPNRSRFEWLNYFFLRGNCLCHPTLLIRRECYDAVGSLDERLAQLPDLDFWVRLCLRYEIHILQEPLIHFRLHGAEGNASGKTPAKTRRARWEYRHVLDHYLTIQDVQMLQKIFPEAQKYGNNVDPQLIPFVLAMIALETPPPLQVRQMFGIETLYFLLRDDQTAAKLEAAFGFTYRNFIELTGRFDLFGISEIHDLRERIKHPLRAWSKRLIGGA
jgi:glycosyltransferase involved in cell wall biosynthesis